VRIKKGDAKDFRSQLSAELEAEKKLRASILHGVDHSAFRAEVIVSGAAPAQPSAARGPVATMEWSTPPLLDEHLWPSVRGDLSTERDTQRRRRSMVAEASAFDDVTPIHEPAPEDDYPSRDDIETPVLPMGEDGLNALPAVEPPVATADMPDAGLPQPPSAAEGMQQPAAMSIGGFGGLGAFGGSAGAMGVMGGGGSGGGAEVNVLQNFMAQFSGGGGSGTIGGVQGGGIQAGGGMQASSLQSGGLQGNSIGGNPMGGIGGGMGAGRPAGGGATAVASSSEGGGSLTAKLALQMALQQNASGAMAGQGGGGGYGGLAGGRSGYGGGLGYNGLGNVGMGGRTMGMGGSGFSAGSSIRDDGSKPHNYRTKPCRYFQQGMCKNGDRCTFLHTTEGAQGHSGSGGTGGSGYGGGYGGIGSGGGYGGGGYGGPGGGMPTVRYN